MLALSVKDTAAIVTVTDDDKMISSKFVVYMKDGKVRVQRLEDVCWSENGLPFLTAHVYADRDRLERVARAWGNSLLEML